MLERRDNESGCLASTIFGTGKDIAFGKGGRDGFFLDGRGLLKTCFKDPHKKLTSEIHVLEFEASSSGYIFCLWAQVLGRWSESGFPGVTCVTGGCSKARVTRSAPSEVWWIDEKAHDDDEGGGRDIDRSSEKSGRRMYVQVRWRVRLVVVGRSAAKMLVESKLCGQKLSCSDNSHATPYVQSVSRQIHAVKTLGITRETILNQSAEKNSISSEVMKARAFF